MRKDAKAFVQLLLRAEEIDLVKRAAEALGGVPVRTMCRLLLLAEAKRILAEEKRTGVPPMPFLPTRNG